MRGRIAVFSLTLLLSSGCARPVPRSNEVVAIASTAIPSGTGDPVWNEAPEYFAKLLPQDIVEPRLLKPSTPEVRVRAVVSAGEIAFRLEWTDSSPDDQQNAGEFVDACAVQIPEKMEPEPPDPQMGAAGKAVDIAYWRADWQASVNGRDDSIKSLFPNATVDHYPFEAQSLERGSAEQQEFAKRYAPADAVGNRRQGVRQNPVEDLRAEGPGTLAPTGRSASRGTGGYSGSGWSVMIVRPLPAGLVSPARTQIAFAVWEGSKDEVGARKMRSAWVPLAVREAQ